MSQKSWMLRMATALMIIMLPVGFILTLLVLFFIYPDAGPGAIVFFPVAFVCAFVVAGVTVLIYRLLIHIRWWAGLPVLAVAFTAVLLVGYQFLVTDPEVERALHTTCVVNDPAPGQDVSHCAVYYSLPVDWNPAQELFAIHGWTVETGKASLERIPAKMSASWRIWLDFSRDVGLDFSSAVGKEVWSLSFPIQSGRELTGPSGPCVTHGRVVQGQDDRIIGAWVECWTHFNGPSRALPGYSLRGRSVQEVTGDSWTWYQLKYYW